MSTPAWQRAAERIRKICPVRTHSQHKEMLPPEGDRRGRQSIPSHHKAGRQVRVRGKTYKSISATSRALGVHPREIYAWIRQSKAKFL